MIYIDGEWEEIKSYEDVLHIVKEQLGEEFAEAMEQYCVPASSR